jgi:hypothetical protein
MSINSHLSTCVGTQSPKYLEMAQGHISLSRVATLCDELCKLNMEVFSSGTLGYISVETTLHEQIIMAQIDDKGVQVIKGMLE